ncbi:MAG TPA: cytochrome C oxidase subunit I [Burkholderiales bacterium]|nr:cytochrome C oxidase subunit I [Burkholderiales bacterium]
MRAKAKLALLFAACAAPFVLAWLAYEFRWGAGASGNYGELIAPRPVAGPLAALRGKWVLVTLDPAACDAACEKKLYIARQARRAQGKEANRVERLWLVTDGGKPRPELLAAIEGAHVVGVDAAFAAAFPARDSIYLVDPLGNLMMRFPPEPDPAKVIKDLQRLLKYSRFG